MTGRYQRGLTTTGFATSLSRAHTGCGLVTRKPGGPPRLGLGGPHPGSGHERTRPGPGRGARAGGGVPARRSPRPRIRLAWSVSRSGADGPARLQPALQRQHVVLPVPAVTTQGPHGHQTATGGQPAKTGQRHTEGLGGLGRAHHPNVVHLIPPEDQGATVVLHPWPGPVDPTTRNVGFRPPEEHGPNASFLC